MATRMQQRRGTAAEWTAADPILASGEIGFETDSNSFKIGDGVNQWSTLAYFQTLGDLVDGAPDLLNTLNELAAAIGDDPEFIVTINNSLGETQSALEAEIVNRVAGDQGIQDLYDALSLQVTNHETTADAAILQLQTDLSQEVSDREAAITNEVADRDAAIATAIAAEVVDRDAAITTAVSAEATARDLAISNAVIDEATARDAAIAVETDARIAAVAAEAVSRDDAISAHNLETLNVHGIADTSALATQTDVANAQNAAEVYANGLAVNYDAAGSAAAAQTAAETTASGYVSTHNSETLNVHGIADTSDLVVTADLTQTLADAETYADTQDALLIGDVTVDGSLGNTVTDRIATAKTGAESTAASYVSTHEATTTNIHGIADTADLALLSAASQTLSGDLTIAGSLTVQGTTTTVSATDLVVTDPLIYIGEGNTGNAVDLGVVSSFDDGTYQHAGIVRDASAGIWKIFKGVTDEPTTTVNFAQGSLDDLAVNNVEVAGVVFTDGTQTKVGVPSISEINEHTGTTYSLASVAERDTIVELNNASAITLTIPDDSTVNFPVGTTLDIIQTGAGQVTVVGGTGVTVNATPGLKLRTQWSSATLLKRAANLWLVYGDLSA